MLQQRRLLRAARAPPAWQRATCSTPPAPSTTTASIRRRRRPRRTPARRPRRAPSPPPAPPPPPRRRPRPRRRRRSAATASPKRPSSATTATPSTATAAPRPACSKHPARRAPTTARSAPATSATAPASARIPTNRTARPARKATSARRTTQCVEGACVGGQPLVCNDNDICTNDTCVPDIGCLFEIGIESPECGSCEDGIDNDGDGLPDAEDPDCSTFHQLQRFAIIGTATNGLRSLRLGREAMVVESDVAPAELTATLRAGACGVDMKASIGTLVTGAVALEGNARFSGGRPPVRILYQFVNDNAAPSAVLTGQTVPLVGPPSMCTDGVTPCLTNDNCPSSQKCEAQLTINDPTNPHVDQDRHGAGVHPLPEDHRRGEPDRSDHRGADADRGAGRDPPARRRLGADRSRPTARTWSTSTRCASARTAASPSTASRTPSSCCASPAPSASARARS